MKTAKKLTWAMLALLPVMSFLWLLLGQIGQPKPMTIAGDELPFMPLWTDVVIEETDDYFNIVASQSVYPFWSLTDFALCSFTGTQVSFEKESVMGAFCNLYSTLTRSDIVPAAPSTFFGMLYLFYIAFLELVSVLIDLIMFVPRKCGEIFR